MAVRFSPEEDETIIRMWPNHSRQEILNCLAEGRSEDGLTARARKLGLPLKSREPYVFAEEQVAQMKELRSNRFPWAVIAKRFETTSCVVRRIVEGISTGTGVKRYRPRGKEQPLELQPLEMAPDHFAVDAQSFRLITGREPRYDR